MIKLTGKYEITTREQLKEIKKELYDMGRFCGDVGLNLIHLGIRRDPGKRHKFFGFYLEPFYKHQDELAKKLLSVTPELRLEAKEILLNRTLFAGPDIMRIAYLVKV